MKDLLEQNGGFFLDFETFALMKKALWETFASGAYVIIATMAKPCGKRMYAEITRKTNSKKETLNQLCILVNEQNWGELSFLDVDFDKGKGRIIVKDSFEARESTSEAPCCHFLSNFLTGFITELFNKNVVVKELKCAGKGDEYCEFRF